MSFSNAFETELLDLIFTNSAIANLGDAGGPQGSSTAGNLYISLHTSDPGEAGSQTTNETAYTSYARVAVARSGAGWTVSGNQVSNAAQIQFPQCTGGSSTVTHFAVGYDSAGAGVVVMSGALSSSLAVSNGITPLFAASALTATLD
jgi:hypothetical protein